MAASPPVKQTPESPRPEDLTVVLTNAVSTHDATVIMTANEHQRNQSATHDDAFLRQNTRGAESKSSEEAPAAAKKHQSANPDDSTLSRRNATGTAATRRSGAAGGGFLSPVVLELVSKGLLPEREAISLALRARDLG